MAGNTLAEITLILLSFLLSMTYSQYQYGDIRLAGSPYQWEGRVEIYLSGTWGTVTDSQWSSDDAQVVCRKLGYFKPGAVPQSGAYFGEGSDPIHLDYVQCSGREYDLMDCGIANNTKTFSHMEDVGVQCQPADGSYEEGDIRLIGGSRSWEGRVEIYISRVWGAVGSSPWTTANAEVVCRQLGHSTSGTRSLCCGNYGQSSRITHINAVMCFGLEPHITNCSYQNFTMETRNSEGAEVQCQQGINERNGDIRLVGGSHSREGRVEIYLSETWGTINHETYNSLRAAQVACRQLGFEVNGATYFNYATFGEGVGPIHMDNINCLGTEYRLRDCGYDNDTGEDTHAQDWSIRCPRDGPESGDIQLRYNYNGPLEIFTSGSWHRVSASTLEWTSNNSQVVCRQLGYLTTGSSFSYQGLYGQIHLDDVSCNGSESKLTECIYNDTVITGSNYLNYIEVRCQQAICLDQETRLIGGQTEREGRVELCSSGRWGTVCDSQWSSVHTQVVCRHLGFSDKNGISTFEFGEGTGPVFMDYINCTGSEFRLWDCPHFTHYYGCTHASDVGISCQPAACEDGQIRLVEGSSDWSGRIEVCLNKRWGTVADDSWDNTDARVACRELGFSQDYGRSYCCSSFRRGGGPIYMTYFSCSGDESRLFDCMFSNDTSSYRHNEDAGVRCSPARCSDGEVRLVEGETEFEGRLEVCLGRRWGTVSSDEWSSSDAQVICRDFGYDLSNDNAMADIPLAASKPIFLDSVDCSGEEINILDCSYDSDTSEDDHFKDVVVKCQEPSCKDGDIRLSGRHEGRVEVCFSQRWGTVNGDGWSDRDSQVVCRQLGFSTNDASFYLTDNKGAEISLPIHMDNVGCYGNERMLVNCSYHKDTSEDNHSEDVAVRCPDDGGIDSAQRATIVSLVSLVVVLVCICAVVVVALVIAIIYLKKRRKLNFDAITPQNVVPEGKELQSKSAETTFGASNVYVHPENPNPQYDYDAVTASTGVSYKPKPISKPGPSSQRPPQNTEPRRYTRGVQKPRVNAVPRPIVRHNTPPEEIYEEPDND